MQSQSLGKIMIYICAVYMKGMVHGLKYKVMCNSPLYALTTITE